MELKEIMKIYKDAGYEVNDVRTEEKRAIEVNRLKNAYGGLYQVTAEALMLNPDSDLVEGEWIVIPDVEDATEGTTEAPEGTVDPGETITTGASTTYNDVVANNPVLSIDALRAAGNIVGVSPDGEVTVSDTAKQDYFRGNAVIRVENRVQNGRVYKQVQTITETYLVNEDEYVAGLTSK